MHHRIIAFPLINVRISVCLCVCVFRGKRVRMRATQRERKKKKKNQASVLIKYVFLLLQLWIVDSSLLLGPGFKKAPFLNSIFYFSSFLAFIHNVCSRHVVKFI